MCKVGRIDHHSVAVTWHGRRMCKVGRNDHHSVAVTWHWSHIYHTMTLSLYKKKKPSLYISFVPVYTEKIEYTFESQIHPILF